MIYISRDPNYPDEYVVNIFDNDMFYVGSGVTLEAAYEDALVDKEPYTYIHSCETEADFHNLKHTHPELFL